MYTKYNSEKTKQIIQYIIHSMITEYDMPTLSRLKIHHIIFFSDKEYFFKNVTSLTGATYYKHKDGPISYEIMRDIKAVIKECFDGKYKGTYK